MAATQYADESDLVALGLGARALSGLSTTVKTSALVAASSVADGYLAAQYGDRLPLTTWPEALRLAVAKIAAWTLVSGAIGFNPEGSPEMYLEQYKQGVAWLRDVSIGRISLPSFSASPARSAAPAVVSGSSRGF